jgi:hypothetical protein
MNIDNIIELAMKDPGLTQAQKQELSAEHNRNIFKKLLSGSAGATLVVALSKYKGLGTTAKTLLGSLGFGAGVLIYNYYNRTRFANYNNETGAYDIDTNRY